MLGNRAKPIEIILQPDTETNYRKLEAIIGLKAWKEKEVKNSLLLV